MQSAAIKANRLDGPSRRNPTFIPLIRCRQEQFLLLWAFLLKEGSEKTQLWINKEGEMVDIIQLKRNNVFKLYHEFL